MAFQPGQSGNPGGRPKDKPFRDALRMELAALGENDPRALRGLARKLLASAADGDNTLAAIREVADRLDGKPAQGITNDDDEAFQVALRPLVREIVDPKREGSDS